MSRCPPAELRDDPLGRDFGWLWRAYAVSVYGSWLGFGAFSVIAIRVLHVGSLQVSSLAAAGLAIGAIVAVPLGPWVEFRRKRPVMVGMDLIRFVALMSLPIAFALDALTYVQLLVVSVIAAAAKITFNAASAANLKALVRPEDLLTANGRFESTNWTATVIGPPLGGAAIGLFGPVATVVADAISYLLSALGIAAIRGTEKRPAVDVATCIAARDLLEGWKYILGQVSLRRLFFNSLSFNGLLLATEPLLSVLMLGRLGFAPWQYGLAFAAPCVGGLVGSRLASRLVARFGQRRVLLIVGVSRACWPVGLAFIGSGVAGLVVVIALQFGVVTSCGIFNPILASFRLAQTDSQRVARTLSAWSVSTSMSIAALTACWGALAELIGLRAAIAAAGVLLLATPLLLLRDDEAASVAVAEFRRGRSRVPSPSIG